MNIESLPEDIVIGLKNKKFLIARMLNWWSPIRLRTIYFIGLIRGYFSIKEFFNLLLPTSLSKTKWNFVDLHHLIFVDKETKRETSNFLSADGCFNLFGKKLSGFNYYETIGLINEVIVLDQYHAENLIKNDSVVIDAGANIGIFSIFASKFATEGKIYAFEPAPKTFNLLKNNIKDYNNISCLCTGLGDSVSKKNIVVRERETGGNVIEDSPFLKHFSNDQSKLINITTIDQFVSEKKLNRLDFIKIDTEGYEEKILLGAKETIKRYKPIVVMSAYHNATDKENLPRTLKEIYPNYVCELHKDCEEDFVCYAK
jgi:FkbM family methyltransferase